MATTLRALLEGVGVAFKALAQAGHEFAVRAGGYTTAVGSSARRDAHTTQILRQDEIMNSLM